MLAAVAPTPAERDVSLLDIIELDMGFTTIVDNYYRATAPQTLLDGARVGIVAYLRGRGIDDPQVPLLRARADGRGVVPAIEQQIGKAIARYGRRVDARELVYGAIRGELAALHDPYSVLFTKSELHGFSTSLDGRTFGGIGVVLARDGTQLRADSVFAGGPAERAGLQSGDRLIAIDGESVDGVDSAQLAKRLRGPAGSTVRLTIARDEQAPRVIAIVRAVVTPPDVTSRLLPGNIGYMALRTFGPDAGEHVHAALVRLHAAGARGIVFDLRGNGGGYEQSAVRVASAFVPSGTVVATENGRGRRSVTPADGSAVQPQLPLVLLVDGDSASASELVTGAIADHDIGTTVGVRTFGKGVVQTLFPLPDGGALKVTTARYFTPSGRDIDRVGITPAVVVDEPASAQRGVPGSDAQLDAAVSVLARKLQ